MPVLTNEGEKQKNRNLCPPSAHSLVFQGSHANVCIHCWDNIRIQLQWLFELFIHSASGGTITVVTREAASPTDPHQLKRGKQR